MYDDDDDECVHHSKKHGRKEVEDVVDCDAGQNKKIYKNVVKSVHGA